MAGWGQLGLAGGTLLGSWPPLRRASTCWFSFAIIMFIQANALEANQVIFDFLFKIVIALSWFRRDWSEKKQPNWILRLRKAEKFRWVFDYLTIFKPWYCKTIESQQLHLREKFLFFDILRGKKHTMWPKYSEGPHSRPLILGIVHLRWDDHPTLDPHRAWSQSNKLFLIAHDHQDHQDHHPTLDHHEFGRNRANYSWLLAAGTRHWARPSPWDSNHSSCSASSQASIVLL